MIYPANFFGLTIYPGKAYTTVLEDDTHLTMAAVAAELGKEATGRTSVVLTIDGNAFTLCSLTPGKTENQPIDIYLTQDEEVTFTVKGSCPIDLTGNVVAIIPPEDEMFDEEDMLDEQARAGEDEEIDSDEVSGDEEEVDEDGLPVVYGESDEEEITEEYLAELKKKIAAGEIEVDSDEMEEDDFEEGSDSEESNDEEEMEFDAALVAELNKRKMVAQPIPRNDKKAKITEIVEEKEKPSKKEAAKASSKSAKENTKPAEIKKESESKKQTDSKNSKKEAATENKKEMESKTEPLKKTLPSGLVIEDSIVGTGPRAKSGQKVSVRYIGKLTNGKVFDSNTKGAPFSFKLGKGQVIKGWDMGVQGMNVGGTRKLTIPAPLAYGKQGCPPDIPKNATLEFEVKLLSTK